MRVDDAVRRGAGQMGNRSKVETPLVGSLFFLNLGGLSSLESAILFSLPQLYNIFLFFFRCCLIRKMNYVACVNVSFRCGWVGRAEGGSRRAVVLCVVHASIARRMCRYT
jgi:hypothetical protein